MNYIDDAQQFLAWLCKKRHQIFMASSSKFEPGHYSSPNKMKV